MDDLLLVIKAWTHKDDWDVDTIYLSTIERLVQWLNEGIPAQTIADHAKHWGEDHCPMAGK
jgi:hypothetical protein